MAPVNHPVIHGGDLPSDLGGVTPTEFWLRGDRPRRPRLWYAYTSTFGIL